MYYKYRVLWCWSSTDYPELTEEKIQNYFKYSEDFPKYGLYEEWVVLSEHEFVEYRFNHWNHDYFIRVIEKEEYEKKKNIK